jgi:nickel superoxide dismutase
MRGFTLALFVAVVLAAGNRAEAHCEIPCGIYGDDLRFSMLQEDIATIEKSMTKVVELSADPVANANQITRWILNKEKHADHIREIATQYFMTQRIKWPDEDDAAAVSAYTEHLGSLHKMLVYAMKSKQTTDTMWTQKLHDTVHAFQEAYTR